MSEFARSSQKVQQHVKAFNFLTAIEFVDIKLQLQTDKKPENKTDDFVLKSTTDFRILI